MGLRALGVLLLMLAVSGCDQSSPLQTAVSQNDIISALDEQAILILENVPNASLAVAVVRKGQVEFVRLYDRGAKGQNVVGAQEPIFEVASLGKPVFAYLVMKMVELDILSLDRPLAHYEPDLVSGADLRLNSITARMVLSHTSGLSNFEEDQELKLSFDPGTSFAYSGLGYSLLQQVLERKTGLPLETLAHIHVFEPLGMSSSSFIWQRAYNYRIRDGFNQDGQQIAEKRRPSTGNAAWSLHTTASDYARFLAFMMDTDNEGALKQRMLQADKKISEDISWSLGWGIQSTKPNRSIWHWGSNPGYRAYVVGYPQEDIGIVVLSNNETLFTNIEPLILKTIGGALPSYHWF
ncbi:serine hydrolase domain-containing protein [Pseudovibrio sp. Tun.PSC04-5.I4]|uniref:serine hydrolase domain-containing protein n=1 Tax=Pseudovibrio sp. Tun.PSC04-5.I4 TaxID=1798213 RepID=UPI000885BFF7|nr:serine hydrolase domain-containing protein [Pseudovibrio sp. Tun.PSC04-5.I4]SDQ16443.1 CubicO group peptidase, beta-lactamase class C family [Pseudovibrio sp. Tun.PSC04-5.I4]